MPVEEQFERLIGEHKNILYKVCNLYCSHRDNREDLAQEIIIQLWRSFKTFDGRCKFSTWMYRIALNVAISFYRQETVRTRHLFSVEEQFLHVIAAPPGPSEDMQSLYEYIEALEPLSKALLLLYLDGNSYQEIADVLGISETNVATKISRLKQTMRKEVG